MESVNQIEKLLEKYNEDKDEGVRSDLISYVLETEKEILSRRVNDDSFKPHTGDEYAERRELLSRIRKDLNLTSRNKDQMPPENLKEVMEDIVVESEQTAEEIKKIVEDQKS